MHFCLSRSSDQPGLKKSSSFHAYFGSEADNEDRIEDVEFVAQSGSVMLDSTVNVEEPSTTKVELKEETKDDKIETADSEDSETETDMEAEFTGMTYCYFMPLVVVHFSLSKEF